MAHYTIFELERIEKILEAKLDTAKEMYNERVRFLQGKFKYEMTEAGKDVQAIAFEGAAVGYPGDGVSGVLSDAWEKFQADDEALVMLGGEVRLFEEGIDALYSYWNSAVELFIDNMREKTEERMTQ